jgi:hypothetical protein
MSTKPELIEALITAGDTAARSTLQKRSLPFLEARLAARQAAAPPPPEPQAPPAGTAMAADLKPGQHVRLANGAAAATVTAVSPAPYRLIRVDLSGRLPYTILSPRHPVTLTSGPDPDGETVFIPLSGQKPIDVARLALAGILPGVLRDDSLAVWAAAAPAVANALRDIRPQLNDHGRDWARALRSQVLAAFPEAAPAAPAKPSRSASPAERVARVTDALRAAKAAKAALQAIAAPAAG